MNTGNEYVFIFSNFHPYSCLRIFVFLNLLFIIPDTCIILCLVTFTDKNPEIFL